MKIIAFDRHADSPFILPPAVELIADSAVVTPPHPLFLPDFDTEWEGRICPAYRIGRLGKTVDARFAPRYIDAYGLVLRLIPAGTDKALRAAGMPAGLDGMFDSALYTGAWLPTEGVDMSAPLAVSCAGVDSVINNHFEAACKAVECVTRYATVKTGDIIIPSWMPVCVVPRPGVTIEGSIDGAVCLSVRIK